MLVFATLLLMHLLADFYLQKHAWIMDKVAKKHRSVGLFKHILVHVLLTTLALWAALPVFAMDALIALAVIVGTHYLIDIWKTYQRFELPYFLADQVAHIAILAAVSAWLSGMSLSALGDELTSLITASSLAVLCIYVLALTPLSIVMSLALRPYINQFDDTERDQVGLANAGEWIGFLERMLIISFVLLGQYSAVGFLLAAKSVFRFGDMRRASDRKHTEYILLGTLLSFTLAIALGQLGRYILAHG